VPLARELRKVLVERLGTKLEATMSQGQKFERTKIRPVPWLKETVLPRLSLGRGITENLRDLGQGSSCGSKLLEAVSRTLVEGKRPAGAQAARKTAYP